MLEPAVIDSMAHVDDPRVEEPEALWRRASAMGVTAVINAGVDPIAVPPVRWSDTHGVRVLRAYGLHPQAIDAFGVTAQLDALAELLGRDDVVAVGEIGLDARPGMPPEGLQQLVLRTQLQLARQLELPVILHCVHAVGPLLEILSDVGRLPAGGVIHGFGGPADVIKRLNKLGYWFSFGGLVTRETAKRCREAAREVPADRLLVESDTPDHAPVGAGDQSEPASIRATLEALAALRRESVEALAERTERNARRVYRLD